MRIGVFIGRFQPFHVGHEHVVREALQKVDKLLILIGSSGGSRTARNPWTYEERREMIERCFHWEVANGSIEFEPIRDHPSDERWLANTRNAVDRRGTESDEILLVGFAKDHSSFYLNLFPDWGSIAIDPKYRILAATPLRNHYFSELQQIPTQFLPGPVFDYLHEWRTSDGYYTVYYEHQAIAAYKAAWKGSPFPPTFITVDAVVVQSGHILLVRRKDFPGQGLLALPGGFINEYERIRDAAVRELKEETEIADRRGKIPAGRLQTYITETKVYDNPYRSSRGRTVTHAHLFRLPDAKPLWAVNGGDDAASADWHPLASLRGEEFFEDHFSIVQDMLGL